MKQISLFATALLAASGAFAQTAIDQNKALAGNVTPGDTPGFPVTLSAPGSYKLTGNLTVPQGSKGIVITADEVTLDLNGFRISGPSKCTRNAATRIVSCTHDDDESIGIDARAATGSMVRNGTVTGFGGAGVHVGTADHYDGLRLAENKWGLLSLVSGSDGGGAHVRNCTLETNRNHGMFMFRGLVSNCRALNNGVNGFAGNGPGLTVTDSQALGNGGMGFTAVSARGTYTDRDVHMVRSMGANMKNETPY